MKTHKFTLNAGVVGGDALVMIDDLDLTDCCRSFSVEAASGGFTVVRLTLYGHVVSNIACHGSAEPGGEDGPRPGEIDVTVAGDSRRLFMDPETGAVRGATLYPPSCDAPLAAGVTINDPNGDLERKLRRR